jgi:predicted transcriptional regulator
MATTLKEIQEIQKQLDLARKGLDLASATTELITTLNSAQAMMNELVEAGMSKETILGTPGVKIALEAFKAVKARNGRSPDGSFDKGGNGYRILEAIADGKSHEIKKLYTDLRFGNVPDVTKGTSHIGKVVAKDYATLNDKKTAVTITPKGKEAIKSADAKTS